MVIQSQPSSPLTTRDPRETIAYVAGDSKSVGDLLLEANTLAKSLPKEKFSINLHNNRYQYLVTFCAALMAGQSTLMPPNRQPMTLDEIEQLYPESYRIDDSASPEYGKQSAELIKDGISSPAIEDDFPAIVAFTSGSTGTPSSTQKSWRTLRVSTTCNFNALLNGIRGVPSLVATVPCQHMWGFETTVLLPLLHKVTISHRKPLYPEDIASALREVPSPRILVSSPLHLRTLMRSQVEFPRLERILTATAPLSAPEATAFESHFGAEVLDAFGCTESGVIATRRTALETSWSLLPAFRLEVGEDTTSIHADHLPEPVLLPDAVELIDAQSFKWLGRNQDMVKIAGKRGSLADLNARLARIDGVADGVIFQPPGTTRLAAMVVAPGMDGTDVLEALKPQVEPAFIPRPILMVDMLPRQETGKLSLSATRELFETIRAQLQNE